jgi:hypothetical protein
MKKLLLLCVLWLVPTQLYALDLGEALGKIVAAQEPGSSNSSVVNKLGCGIKEEALKQIKDIKLQLTSEIASATKSVDGVKERADSSFAKIDDAIEKLNKYDELAKQYLSYLQMAICVFLGLVVVIIIMLALLYLKVTKFQKKIAESLMKKALSR